MGTSRDTRVTDQELVDAQHGNTSNLATLWSVVFRSSDSGAEVLTPVHLFVEPHRHARGLAIEFGVRMLGGARVVSMERCE